MRILITGGAGFVGSHVVDRLLEQGHDVTVLDNLSTGRADNVPQPATLVELDVRAPLDSTFAQVQPEVVIHLAAQVSVPLSTMDPVNDLSVNIGGTANVMAAAARAGTRKVVSISSAAVYGIPRQIPVTEDSLLSPLAPYGLSKMAGERYVQMLHGMHGIDYTIIRPANIFGPRQTTQGEGAVVPAFLNRFLSGEDPLVQGDGEQTRDFIYVGDMAEAIIRSIGCAGSAQILNVSSGRACTVNSLWRLLAGLTGWRRQPVHVEPRQGDIRHSVLDNSQARESLGWTPQVSLVEGLQATVRWYLDAKASGWLYDRPAHRAVAI